METNLMLRLRLVLALAAISTSLALLGGVVCLFGAAADAPADRAAFALATANRVGDRGVHGPPSKDR